MLKRLHNDAKMQVSGAKQDGKVRIGGFFMTSQKRSKDHHIFYAFLKFHSKSLADEKDKKSFLDFALQPKEDWGSVLAFTVLDDEVHFLLQIKKTAEESSEQTAERILEQWSNYLEKMHKFQQNPELFLEGIEQEEQMLKICKEIHQLAVNQGYVKERKDYWWSSFQSYRGVYSWEKVDVQPILSCFSEDLSKARIMFQRFHRKES